MAKRTASDAESQVSRQGQESRRIKKQSYCLTTALQGSAYAADSASASSITPASLLGSRSYDGADFVLAPRRRLRFAPLTLSRTPPRLSPFEWWGLRGVLT